MKDIRGLNIKNIHKNQNTAQADHWEPKAHPPYTFPLTDERNHSAIPASSHHPGGAEATVGRESPYYPLLVASFSWWWESDGGAAIFNAESLLNFK